MNKLTPAQRKLLVRMYRASPTRILRVNDLGFKMPVLVELVRKGYAIYGKTPYGDRDQWRGKLTSAGRREAKLLEHIA
jgi:hypothetical protein